MDETTLSFILMGLSTLIMTFVIIISIKQTCITNTSDAQRCIRAAAITTFIISQLILNILIWMASLYPHTNIIGRFNLYKLSKVYEAITTVFGFAMYKRFELWVIDKIYKPVNMYPPQWIDQYFTIRQIFITITISFCYSFAVLQFLKSVPWIFIFYWIFGFIVFIEATLILWVLLKIVNIMSNVQTLAQKQTDIDMKYAKRIMYVAIGIAIIILLTGIAMTILVTEAMINFIRIDYNETLIRNIFQSLLIIIVASTLLTWIFQKHKWLHIPNDSICEVCVFLYCSCCCTSNEMLFMDDTTTFNNNKNNNAIVLEQSATRIQNQKITITGAKKTITPFGDRNVHLLTNDLKSNNITLHNSHKQSVSKEKNKKILNVMSLFVD